MNGPIPAGGEAMPSRMNRRAFLAGAAVALAAPAVAMEAANDQSEIFRLIREIDKARDLATAADEAEYDIYARGDRPDYPAVAGQEVPYMFRAFGTKSLNTVKQIDDLFDHYAAGRRRQFEWLAEVCEGGVLPQNHQAALAQQLQEGEDQRQRVQSLYAERDAAYRTWEQVSGHLAAQEVTEARWNVVWALEDRIIRFPCKTLEEVAAKARYIVARYGDVYAREKQHAFIAEVAGLVEAAEAV
ncbi:hypothetical protein [Sinorhizobium sp. RAC02]|uniref:hypothetical protein n=1 Tax=Sinorhizobium sp. RAC02 TaxID=1842534 RepID=UPI00083DA5B6|nr:hypothetical protein [Sinorhizobium sp. RAC02]AOF89431.1 hypothetical protein BSY16_3979 [Sinorhizobium sp. RAC02]